MTGVPAAIDKDVVNDIHSRLNSARPSSVVCITSIDDVTAALGRARAEGVPVAIGGGRHAMGGQQFCDGGMLLDMRGFDRVLAFDRDAGLITVEAGIMWPELVQCLLDEQAEAGPDVTRWGIRQKQTGADRMTIGGTVAANGHGRGLAFGPIVTDVERLTLIDARGELVTCNRTDHAELFSLVVGGYGMFGVICSVTLRLSPRQQVERVVEERYIDTVPAAFEQRIAEGFMYGDFQYAIDHASDDFLRRGIFSCYRPVEVERPVPDDQKLLSREEWGMLLYLAHVDKAKVADRYVEHYLATTGQLYYSDTHQMADYHDGYHEILDGVLNVEVPATEVITEIYVPRDRLTDFMEAAAESLRGNGADVIYGTVRLIEQDAETFLPWARERYACVIFNLHTEHTEAAIENTAQSFRDLIDLGIERGGSYFLTYHRWARKDQVEACYPRFEEFLARKLEHDPGELFQSDWYRHYRAMFA